MHLRIIFRRIAAVASAIALALACASTARAAGKALEIGAAAPDFTLTDQNGTQHALSKHKGKIVVLEFCSQECPVSNGVDPSWVDLTKKYGEKGVVFLGINSHDGTTPAQIKDHVAKAGIPFPIVKDVDNKYADAVGASKTPEIYVLDKDGKLAYHGAFDNRKELSQKGDTNYVANAIDNLLAGQPVKTPTVQATGCGIKRVKKST